MENAVKNHQAVIIPSGNVKIEGDLVLPEGCERVVIFSHGSGSSRFSSRNNYVARILNDVGIGTLLLDLLTEEEDKTYSNRFNINLLTERLVHATQWIKKNGDISDVRIGFFGASTGAASALNAAAELGNEIGTVVSRGGRPDLAIDAIPSLDIPVLLIVGGLDYQVIELNQLAYDKLPAKKEMKIIPGATHLFEEAGTLEEVAKVAKDWFLKYL